MKNTLKNIHFMAGLTALLMAIGSAIGGRNGLLLALVFAGLMNLVAIGLATRLLIHERSENFSESELLISTEWFSASFAGGRVSTCPGGTWIPSATPNALPMVETHSIQLWLSPQVMNILSRESWRESLLTSSPIKNRDILISQCSHGRRRYSQLAHWLSGA